MELHGEEAAPYVSHRCNRAGISAPLCHRRESGRHLLHAIAGGHPHVQLVALREAAEQPLRLEYFDLRGPVFAADLATRPPSNLDINRWP